MPVDANGFRADIIMTPPSIINRMNPSQLYEQFWNRCSDQVVRNAKAANMSWKAAYKYFIEFCKDFRENYGRALDEYILENEQMKREWTEANLARGYIRLLGAWTKGRPYGYLDKMAKKYGVEETPVSYLFTDEETGETTRITTIEPAMIGSKYLMYLGKIPDETLTTVEAAYVNQFETPIKLGSKRIKDQSLVGLTPQKFGEDEICMLTMSLGDEPVARMACVHSAAPSVTKELFIKMLTVNHPTQFMALDMSTQDVISQNRNVLIFADMMGAIGYDVHSQANKDQT